MENRIFWIIAGLILVAALLVLFAPAVEERLAPELVGARVAIEIAGSGVAVVGPLRVAEGTRFDLRAVVEAREGERTIYYTEATRLLIGDREIPADQLRPWNRSKKVKVRWFTVEGRLPYVRVSDEALLGFGYQEFLRSDWPLAWTVPGSLEPANDDHLEPNPYLTKTTFGTQRYHVRVELYRLSDDLVPEQILRSWGADELREHVESFPTVTATVDGVELASSIFGLPQVDPTGDVTTEMRRRLETLWEHRVAWTRLVLLRDLARVAGGVFGDLTWSTVDLDGTAPWGDGPDRGDLLRVGDRVVVLYEDRGQPGRLDDGDLAFDFVDGATVRALGDIFSGEGQGQWAALSPLEPDDSSN